MEEQKDINRNDINMEDMEDAAAKDKNGMDEDITDETEMPEEEAVEKSGEEEENCQENGEAEDAVCEGGAGDDADDAAEGGGKKLFKKKAKTDKKQEAFKQKIEELEDRVKRQMAEFDNFRKRTEKEKTAMYEIGAKSVIEKILPVVDNFERGLAQAVEGDAFAEGMKMIYKQLMTTLEGLGVEAIEAVGKEFDPDFHNAVMHVEDEEVGENMVVEELQKGYTYKGFVVRHSMVKVAN